MLKTVSAITNAIGALNYKGTWNASTNSPALTSGSGTKGDYYVVSVAGSTSLDGISNWGVGDWAAFNGTAWQRVEGGADLNGVNLSVSGNSNLGNIQVTGNTVSSTNTDGNIAITPNGSGEVDISKVDIDSGAIDGTTIGATTTANGSFSTLTAKTPQVTSTTPFYHVIKTGEYDAGGGTQRPAAIVEGAWFIDTANLDIAPVNIGASDKWRVIFIGAWGNYFNGFSVNGPGNYCEVTSDSNTIDIGSLTVTITRNGTTGYLQWSSGTYASEFQGTIIISNSTGAPANSFNVKGGMLALGVYSATVGGTNRDVFVDNTGLIGYVSSTRESKTNIANIDDVSWLSQLQPVTFNRRKKEPILGGENGREVIGEKYSEESYDELEYGLIADDVQGINTELCFYDMVNGVKVLRGVHYSKLIVPLLKRVQQLEADLAALKGA
jgi:hypothetical protein